MRIRREVGDFLLQDKETVHLSMAPYPMARIKGSSRMSARRNSFLSDAGRDALIEPCRLRHRQDDAVNTVLAAAGFRRLIHRLRLLSWPIMAALFPGRLINPA